MIPDLTYKIYLNKGLLDLFLDLACYNKQKECCGLFTKSNILSGIASVYNNYIEVTLHNLHVITNISIVPKSQFIMHPAQVKYIRDSCLINGIIHSHTNDSLIPSEEDLHNLRLNRFSGAYIITDTQRNWECFLVDYGDIVVNHQELTLTK